jgi:hypothetical protein
MVVEESDNDAGSSGMRTMESYLEDEEVDEEEEEEIDRQEEDEAEPLRRFQRLRKGK